MKKVIPVFVIGFGLGWLGSRVNLMMAEVNSGIEWRVMSGIAELKNIELDLAQSQEQRYCADVCAARSVIKELQARIAEAEASPFSSLSDSLRKSAEVAIEQFEKVPLKGYDCSSLKPELGLPESSLLTPMGTDPVEF